MTTAIKLTIPDALSSAANQLVKTQGYHNLQELTLTALRNHIAQQHKEWALKMLAEHKGKFKQIGNPTREERAKAVDELLNSKRNIFKDHGL